MSESRLTPAIIRAALHTVVARGELTLGHSGLCLAITRAVEEHDPSFSSTLCYQFMRVVIANDQEYYYGLGERGVLNDKRIYLLLLLLELDDDTLNYFINLSEECAE